MQNSSVEFHKQTPEGYLRLGSISGISGFRGDAKFFLYNPKTELFGKWLTVRVWKDKEIGQEVQVHLRKGSGKRVVGNVKIVGEPLRTEAEVRAWMGVELLLPVSDLPSLDENEFYHHQLLGMPVENASGKALGTIVEITQGVVDIFSIRQKGSKDLLYIPFTKEHVLETTSEKMIVQGYDSNDGDSESSTSV